MSGATVDVMTPTRMWKRQALGWILLTLVCGASVDAAEFFTGAELLDICSSERIVCADPL